MKLILDSNYQILTDSHNYILQKLEPVKNRETQEVTYKWKDDGYHSTITQALKTYVNKNIADQDEVSANELIQIINDTYEKIDLALNKYKINKGSLNKNENEE
jgi:hypothetical protein